MDNKTVSSAALRAAKDIFQKVGFCDADLKDIAEHAEISQEAINELYENKQDCCLKVIKSYEREVKKCISKIDEQPNPRQRLSMFLDKYFDSAELMAEEGDPILNLYYDVRNMNNNLTVGVEKIIKFQHDWVDQQFITMLKTESAVDQGDRLMAALTGLLLVVRVKKDQAMFKSQIIQLKSWIRSM